MKRTSTFPSWPGRAERETRPSRAARGLLDARVKPAHEGGYEVAGAETLGSPLRGGFMVACWQNGRRVMMHSSEVARLMGKHKGQGEAAKSAPPSTSSLPGLTRQSMTHQTEPQRYMDARVKPAHDEKGQCAPDRDARYEAGHDKVTADLTPPPIVPRSRAIAKNENWQLLAKLMMNASNASRHCAKPACRRAHRCEGGRDACYLREFETVDVVMQRDVLRALKRAGRETDEGAE